MPGPLPMDKTGWVAGLLEAEGTFPLRPTGGGTIRVQMSDKDVIVRLRDTLQIGNLGTFTPRNPRHKSSWMLTVARRDYINWLLPQIAPLMSTRRRDAIGRLAANFRDPLRVPHTRDDLWELPSPVAWAWLAGLIEGDGCIRAGEVSVTSIDQDVLSRAQAAAHCGQIYLCKRQKDHHRDRYVWKITSRHNIDRVLRTISPWMLSRRTSAIRAILPEG
jgi:hypothetical protein